jgi:hypothetical protein
VSWQEVAAATGRVAHRCMQWPSVVGTTNGNHTIPGVFQHPPVSGRLPTSIARTLIEVLEPCTQTPEVCWFAVWVGHSVLGSHITEAPTFSLPNREYHLLKGRIGAVLDDVMEPTWISGSPNLWWPTDRAWCVATEVDFETTYVGGSRHCIDSLLGQADIEAFELEATDGVTWASDTRNSSPVDGPAGSAYLQPLRGQLP